MSECNFCTHTQRKLEAERVGNIISIRPAVGGGTDVFRHPPDVSIPKSYHHKEDPHDEHSQYFIGWYMKLGKRCEC